MDTAVVFNLETVLSLVVFFFIVQWYGKPWLMTLGPRGALVPLLLFSSFRFLGLSFLVPNWTAGLPAAFATPAATGDFIVSLIALAAALALRYGLGFGIALAWLYTVAGTLDFIYAGSLANANPVPQTIGPLWPLMSVLGPAWMVALAFLYRFLIWPAPAAAESREIRASRA
jgi:hypothetical protein